MQNNVVLTNKLPPDVFKNLEPAGETDCTK